MADQTLEILIRAKNDTSSALDALNSSLKQIEKNTREASEDLRVMGMQASDAMTKTRQHAERAEGGLGQLRKQVLGLVGGYFTFKAAVDLVTTSLKAQSDQEAAVNSLNLALANQGRFTQETSKSLQEYADVMQRSTTFSDDAVLSAQAVLASFGQNEAQIKRTTQVAADFAAATKTDLASAAELLGKAFAGNTDALSRYGIVIDESVPKADRFGAAVAQLEQRFHGAAAAATATTTGGFAQLKNAAGEVAEGIGLMIQTLFDSQDGFKAAFNAANQFAQFLKVDVVIAIGKARGALLDFIAENLQAGANLKGLFSGGVAGMLAEQSAENRKHLDLMSQSLREQAEAARESARRTAEAGGTFQTFSNSVRSAASATQGVGRQAKASFDEISAAAEDAARAYEEALNEAIEFSRGEIEVIAAVVAEAEAKAAAERQFIEEVKAAELDAAETAQQVHEERMRAMGELSDSLARAGQEIGGFLGSILQLGSAGIDVFLNLQHQAKKAEEQIAAAANAINAAVSAFKGGSVLGGVMAGASAGAAFGPLGAGIGAALGGLLGLAGGAAKARAELEKMRSQVVSSFGSMQAFAEAARRAGVDASRAFSTKSPKEFEQVVKQANQAIDDQKRRIEGLKTAMGGLELMTKGFAAQMERSKIATEASQAAFSRLGTFAVATFAGLVRETGDVIAALQQMGPSLDTMLKSMADFGFTANQAFAQLLHLRDVVVQNEDVANSISGLNQLMKGLGEATQLTRGLLVDMGAQARANFDELIARGVPANDAMALMQPTLQELWERQRRLGVVYDENTQKLLDNAKTQGLVGEEFLTVNEQMLEVLKILVETLGGTLPAAMRRMGDEADAQFNRMRDGADAAARSVAGIASGHSRFEESSTGGGVGSFASGFFNPSLPRDLGFVAHRGERVEVTRASDTPARNAQDSGGGAWVAAPVILDGQKVGEIFMRRNKAGHFTIAKDSLR